MNDDDTTPFRLGDLCILFAAMLALVIVVYMLAPEMGILFVAMLALVIVIYVLVPEMGK